MKNIILTALLALSFLPVKSFAKEDSALALLTPEEYANLYEADKIKYIKILRMTAADLSFQQEIGFFERLNFRAPVWANLFSNSCEAGENSPAPYYPYYPSHPVHPSHPSHPTYPSYPSYPSHPHYPSQPYYPSYPSYPSQPSYPSYPSYPSQPSYPSYPANPSNPSGPYVVSASSCIRCIYGGFPISNTQTCSPVTNGADLREHIGDLNFPPPANAEEFSCGDAKPVMCNPLLFGAASGKAVCVARSSGATRSCMNSVGNSHESYLSTDKFISLNVPAARSMMTRLSNICYDKSPCYAGAKKSDIKQTCDVVRERILKFREVMRSVKPARPAVPAGAAPVRRST